LNKYIYCCVFFLIFSSGIYSQPQYWHPLGPDDTNQPSYGAVSSSAMTIYNNKPWILFAESGAGSKATVRKWIGGVWVDVGNPGFSPGMIRFPDIAVSPSGTPYVVYQDLANGNRISVQKYDGSAWVQVGQPGFSTGAVTDTKIAIGQNGLPYVVWIDSALTHKAIVMKFDALGWSNVGPAAEASIAGASSPSLTLDSTNSPFLAIADSATGGTLIVRRFDGTNWVDFSSPGISQGVPSDVQLLFKPNGIPYLCYRDNFDNRVYAKVFNGTTWNPLGQPTGPQAYSGSLAFGTGGAVYQAYGDSLANETVKVRKFNGTSWQDMSFPDIGQAQDPLIKLGTNGIIYLACHNNEERVFSYTGGSWHALADTGLGAPPFAFTVNTKGTPYLFVADSAHNGLGTVKKYSDTGWVNVGLPGFTLGLPSIPRIAVNLFNPYVAYRNNLQKVLVYRYDGSNWVVVGNPQELPNGTQMFDLAIDSSDSPYLVYKDLANQGRPTVIKYNGAHWEHLDMILQAVNIIDCAIAIDPAGSPYVIYTNGINNQEAVVKKFENGNWLNVGGASVSTGFTNRLDLTFDSSGRPFIIFQDVDLKVRKFDGLGWVTIGSGLANGNVSSASIDLGTGDKLCIAFTQSGPVEKARAMQYDGSTWVDLGPASKGHGFNAVVAVADTTPVVAFGNYGVFVSKYYADSVTGVSSVEMNNPGFTIYPNPASGSFTIHLDHPGYPGTVISITDVMGRVVYSKPLEAYASALSIPLINIPAGIYLVRIAGPKGNVSRKMVKN
jgi:hypothetical protein